jgi:thiamine kinase-like enzyme
MFYTFKENSFNEKEIISWFENESQTLNRMLKFLGDRMSDKRKELFKTVFSLYPKAAFERINQENITLIHSDAHLLNFFFPQDIENQNSKAKLIDWEFWALGVGVYDLVYMMGLCWYPERRNLMEKDFVKRYHNNLLKGGVKNYNWDDCWYDYRFNAFLNLYRIVYWWDHNYPPNFWWDALERSFLTIEDLNCMELLGG